MGGQVLDYEAKRIRNEGLECGLERGLEQGLAEGLCSMIKTVRLLVGDDFAKVCEIIRENEIYAHTSDEEIRKYWD